MVLAIPLLASAASGADSADEVQALKREVEALRNEVGALRFAVFEMGRLSRQQADLVDQALRSAGGATDAKAPANTPPDPPRRRGRDKRNAPPTAPSLKEHVDRPPPSSGGTIMGKVSVPSGEPVAYVYVEDVPAALVRGKKVEIDQVNKTFAPSWAVVEKGTEVIFTNSDNIYHNVFSRSRGNSFNLGMYRKGDEPKSQRFIKPGPVDVFCNIHPRMAVSILVVPNRYFSKVQSDGSFSIPNVPPGRHKVVAWAPSSAIVSDAVQVSGGESASVELKLVSKSGGHSNKFGRPYGSYP